MTILPKIRTNRGNVGNDVFIQFPDISKLEKTYLSGDEAAGQTTLSVLSGSNFSANEYVVIGTPGSEQTELRKISSADATTITISAATSFSHNQGTIIQQIPFNQIEVYSASSSGGSFSLLSTVSIRVDAFETYYPRTSDASTVYYKARFKNENDTTYSDYSDEVSATGYAYNTIWSIKKRALNQLGEQLGTLITDEFLDDSLFEGRRDVDNQLKKWSFRTSFNTDIGNITEGQYSIAVPATLRDPNTNKNILGLRIGSIGRNISYIPKRQFDSWYEGIVHTTVATQPSVGDTSLVLTNVRDLSDTGSVRVGSNIITYTSKNNSTNTLSGIPASGTGSIDATHAVSTDAWQNASYGEPTQYTIFEGYLYFNVPFDSDFEGENIIMDFYKTIPEKDSDADVLDEPDVDMLVSYLKYRIKDKKSKGQTKKDTDPDYQDYILRRGALIRKDISGQDTRFTPDIGHLIDID